MQREPSAQRTAPHQDSDGEAAVLLVSIIPLRNRRIFQLADYHELQRRARSSEVGALRKKDVRLTLSKI